MFALVALVFCLFAFQRKTFNLLWTPGSPVDPSGAEASVGGLKSVTDAIVNKGKCANRGAGEVCVKQVR